VDLVVQENNSYIVFSKKNKITSSNVTIYRILFEYILWVLGGKPDEHRYEGM
jgi:hypothetical protein